MLEQATRCVLNGEDLSVDDAMSVLQSIFLGHVDVESLVSFLVALSDKGESVTEIVGFARVMRDALISVDVGCDCLDLCGTGGSGRDRFNISTASAFVLGSLGIPVVKHGNRGSQKANGSFDFLEALGLSLVVSPEEALRQFEQYGLTFLFARHYHPGMRYVSEARQSVDRRTIFNLLGPLCSPARVTHQILGTTQYETAQKLAEALQFLGVKRAFVVVGDQQLDEFTVTGPSFYFDVGPDWMVECELNPDQYGLYDRSVRSFGLAVESAAYFKNLLRVPNRQDSVFKQLVLNGAMAQVCLGVVDCVDEGVDKASDILMNGTTHQFFQTFMG